MYIHTMENVELNNGSVGYFIITYTCMIIDIMAENFSLKQGSELDSSSSQDATRGLDVIKVEHCRLWALFRGLGYDLSLGTPGATYEPAGLIRSPNDDRG